MDQAKNFAKGTLTTGYDDTATSIVLNTGEGARFPVAPFNAVWWNSTDYPDPADDPNREIVRVTAKSTDTFTITRGQEGTGGITHNTEGKVYKLAAGLTAKTLNDDMPNFANNGGNDRFMNINGIFSASATQFLLTGVIGTDQYSSASGPVGTVVQKIAVSDENGDLLGYIPVYSSIT